MNDENVVQKASRRITDYRGEKALGLFLDEFFYSALEQAGIIDSFERVYSKNEQVNGSDIKIHIKKGTLVIDEKAQLYYINHPVDTFALEVDYIKPETGNCVDGWFMDSQNKTDSYLFIWIPRAKESRIERIVSHDFLEIEAYLVGKDKIKEWLGKIGLSADKIKAIAADMRSKDEDRRKINEDIRFRKSSADKYVEAPVNIVISKRVLAELTSNRYKISRNGYSLI